MTVLADREMHQWSRLVGADQAESSLPRRCFTAAWLLGATDHDTLAGAVTHLPELQRATPERVDQVAHWLLTLYPGPGPGTFRAPLDLIAHAICIPLLLTDPHLAAQLAQGCSRIKLAQVVATILAAGDTHPGTLPLAANLLGRDGQPLDDAVLTQIMRQDRSGWALDELLAAHLTTYPPDEVNATALLDDLNIRTDLCHARVALHGVIVAHARRPDNNPDLAPSLDNYAVRLGVVGRHQEALAPAEEALTVRRALAKDNPAAYHPNLAASLRNYAARLAEVGRHQEAEAIRWESGKLRGSGSTSPSK